MEAMGHLTRQRDPEDERQVRLRLTPQGRSLREQAFAYRGGMIEAMGLSAAEYWQLREQMAKLRVSLSHAAQRSPSRCPAVQAKTFAEI
jgi:DNA-binding MarR family transcriptional regulator